jgi:choline monooxygenase
VNDLTADTRNGLDEGRTLTGTWYTSPEIWELEKRRVFEQFWQYVGHVEQVAKQGQYFTFQLGNVPIVVLRDAEGQIRGFVNVCCHRGSEVVLEKEGMRQTLQCHYHGWTYGLDGRLRAAPRSKSQPNFDASEYSLQPVRVETWGPFIFATTSDEAPSLFEQLGVLPDLIAKTGVDLDKVRFRSVSDYDVRANWKAVAENFLECYHCAVTHPSFTDTVDLDSFSVVADSYVITETVPLKDDVPAAEQGAYAPGDIRDGRYSFAWPSFMVNVFPGPMNISTNQLIPLGVDRTLVRYQFFFAPEVSAEDEKAVVDFALQIQDEDVQIVESVQRGAASGYFNSGVFFENWENGPQYFQRLLLDTLDGHVATKS